jgi:hypothetical protein
MNAVQFCINVTGPITKNRSFACSPLGCFRTTNFCNEESKCFQWVSDNWLLRRVRAPFPGVSLPIPPRLWPGGPSLAAFGFILGRLCYRYKESFYDSSLERTGDGSKLHGILLQYKIKFCSTVHDSGGRYQDNPAKTAPVGWSLRASDAQSCGEKIGLAGKFSRRGIGPGCIHGLRWIRRPRGNGKCVHAMTLEAQDGWRENRSIYASNAV